MFKNSCFISYRHFDDKVAPAFIKQFSAALKSELNPRVPQAIFLDETRMTGGDFIAPTLATELCRSCCLVMIFCPTYFDTTNNYCTREFLSMQKLEAIRKKGIEVGKGLIIPVIYRDKETFLNSPLNNRKYFNFEKFSLWGSPILKDKKAVKKIRDLAVYIKERMTEFDRHQDVCSDCDVHALVTEEEAIQWLQSEWFKKTPPTKLSFPYYVY